MRRGMILISAVLAACFACIPAYAAERDPARELSVMVSAAGGNAAVLTDGKESSYMTVPGGGIVRLTAEEGISSLYVIFDRVYGAWTLSDGDSEAECGENGFLHEYVDVEGLFGEAPQAVTLTFPEGECSLAEIHAFGPGQVPNWVQIWQPPCERADLLLFSTHIDDEQLFFAGLLPYYAGERGLAVQVAYFTDPFSYHDRPHEQLNGLWTVGIRHYPVSGPFPDAYSESAGDAYAQQERYGYTKEDMLLHQTRLLRRFQPHVAVGHDIGGEYGHGQHRVNSETLMEALELAADGTYDPESATLFGVWDTPKAYIHLWKENPLVMDWDVPLEAFGGKTAFQVTQEGFLCHESQQWTWFRGWIFGKNGNAVTRADQIKTYSPCLYGLYRTGVGPDEMGGDMFEHIPLSYAELAAEERRLEEQRLEEERLRAEEARRAAEEEARRGTGEASDAPTPPIRTEATEEARAPVSLSTLFLSAGAVLALAAGAAVLRRKKQR